ncbi:MAG: DUF504 domain-containing protein [Euryarchaeota archaeon]|nr:DUF504 domain-containing protein [Euryarchaeota archaeon]
MARRTLNELKWHPGKSLEGVEITYLHRGAPGDRVTVDASELVALERSFFVVAGSRGDVRIPYHRIIEIRKDGEVIWKPKSDRHALHGDMKEVDRAIRGGGGRTHIEVQVTPNSRKTALTGVDPWRGRLNIEVREKPVSGRANREVINLFARLLGIPAGEVAITSGAGARQKTVTSGAREGQGGPGRPPAWPMMLGKEYQ